MARFTGKHGMEEDGLIIIKKLFTGQKLFLLLFNNLSMSTKNFKTESLCSIDNIKQGVLNWWNKLDRYEQRTIERETFGDDEP